MVGVAGGRSVYSGRPQERSAKVLFAVRWNRDAAVCFLISTATWACMVFSGVLPLPLHSPSLTTRAETTKM